MTPLANGTRLRYNHRSRVEREKLRDAGWKCHGGMSLLRGLWTHPRLPGHTVSRSAAVTLQAGWDEAKEGVA